MLDALRENIHDNRMLSLVSNMLAVGYLEDCVWNPTLSGVPQSGVASPILSNIYLHRLDMFVEKVLLPEYNRGERRKHSPAYRKVHGELAKAHRRGDPAAVRSLRSLPTLDPYDPDYRRPRYVRYADRYPARFHRTKG
jgi:retron-type reverse transcriptase